jgi:PAS domain S-box-containing protein
MVSATDPCADTVTPRAAAQILELIGEAYVAVDANWRFTYVNAPAERIYGKSREVVLGDNLWQMFPTACGTPFEREYRRIMAERVEGMVEGPFPHLGAWFCVRIYPLDNGGLAFYFSDVTQQRCAEMHLACQKRVQELLFAEASLYEILNVLARAMENVAVNPVLASIHVIDADGHLWHMAAPSLPDTFNDAVDRITPGFDTVPCAAAASSRQALFVANIAEHPSACFRHLACSHELRACWSIPILSPQGVLLGTFTLYFRECVRPFEVETESAALLANVAALIIAHQRLRGATERHTPRAFDTAGHLERARQA